MQSGSAIRRVITGAGANVISQGVATAILFVSVPLLLSRLGAHEYGVWVLLSSIPAYLAMSDLGVGVAAGNAMTASRSAHNQGHAAEIYGRAFTIALIIAGVIILTGATATAVCLEFYSNALAPKISIVLLLLASGTAITLFANLFEAAYRSAFSYSRGVNLSTLIRIMEFVTGMASLLWRGSMVSFAAGMLAGRVAGTLLMGAVLRRDLPEYSPKISKVTGSQYLQLLKPGLAFLSFPVANAFAIQGANIIVGTVLGPGALAVFAAFRTITRALVQAAAIVNKAVWPEITRLYVAGGSAQLKAFYGRGSWVTSGVLLVAVFVLSATGDQIIQRWTGGKLPFDFSTFAMLTTASALTAWGQFPYVIICALNKPESFARWNIGITAMSVPFIYLAAVHWDLVGVSAVLILTECATAICLFVLSSRLLSPKVA